jgi:hypothetical protein
VYTVTVGDYFIFVDGTNGADAASGSKTDPVDDIREGILLAEAAGKDVCVAVGTYLVNSNSAVPAEQEIVLADGVSLYGGYSADGNWNRNITQNVTIITDIAAVAGLTRAMLCGAAITSSTTVDGTYYRRGGDLFRQHPPRRELLKLLRHLHVERLERCHQQQHD